MYQNYQQPVYTGLQQPVYQQYQQYQQPQMQPVMQPMQQMPQMPVAPAIQLPDNATVAQAVAQKIATASNNNPSDVVCREIYNHYSQNNWQNSGFETMVTVANGLIALYAQQSIGEAMDSIIDRTMGTMINIMVSQMMRRNVNNQEFLNNVPYSTYTALCNVVPSIQQQLNTVCPAVGVPIIDMTPPPIATLPQQQAMPMAPQYQQPQMQPVMQPMQPMQPMQQMPMQGNFPQQPYQPQWQPQPQHQVVNTGPRSSFTPGVSSFNNSQGSAPVQNASQICTAEIPESQRLNMAPVFTATGRRRNTQATLSEIPTADRKYDSTIHYRIPAFMRFPAPGKHKASTEEVLATGSESEITMPDPAVTESVTISPTQVQQNPTSVPEVASSQAAQPSAPAQSVPSAFTRDYILKMFSGSIEDNLAEGIFTSVKPASAYSSDEPKEENQYLKDMQKANAMIPNWGFGVHNKIDPDDYLDDDNGTDESTSIFDHPDINRTAEEVSARLIKEAAERDARESEFDRLTRIQQEEMDARVKKLPPLWASSPDTGLQQIVDEEVARIHNEAKNLNGGTDPSSTISSDEMDRITAELGGGSVHDAVEAATKMALQKDGTSQPYQDWQDMPIQEIDEDFADWERQHTTVREVAPEDIRTAFGSNNDKKRSIDNDPMMGGFTPAPADIFAQPVFTPVVDEFVSPDEDEEEELEENVVVPVSGKKEIPMQVVAHMDDENEEDNYIEFVPSRELSQTEIDKVFKLISGVDWSGYRVEWGNKELKFRPVITNQSNAINIYKRAPRNIKDPLFKAIDDRYQTMFNTTDEHGDVTQFPVGVPMDLLKHDPAGLGLSPAQTKQNPNVKPTKAITIGEQARIMGIDPDQRTEADVVKLEAANVRVVDKIHTVMDPAEAILVARAMVQHGKGGMEYYYNHARVLASYQTVDSTDTWLEYINDLTTQSGVPNINVFHSRFVDIVASNVFGTRTINKLNDHYGKVMTEFFTVEAGYNDTLAIEDFLNETPTVMAWIEKEDPDLFEVINKHWDVLLSRMATIMTDGNLAEVRKVLAQRLGDTPELRACIHTSLSKAIIAEELTSITTLPYTLEDLALPKPSELKVFTIAETTHRVLFAELMKVFGRCEQFKREFHHHRVMLRDGTDIEFRKGLLGDGSAIVMNYQ